LANNSSLVELAGIILTGLIVGYFLLITNPPPSLSENNAITHNLSGSEIRTNWSAVLIFIATFFLISTFLVYITGRTISEEENFVKFIQIVSIILLGLIALPYYGPQLAWILCLIGMMGIMSANLALTYPSNRLHYLSSLSSFIFLGFCCMWALADFSNSPFWVIGIEVVVILLVLTPNR
jgi:hypothetical protein